MLVVFPMADRTITGLSSGKLHMRSATSLILSAEATEDPPNFITQVNWFANSSNPWFSVSQSSRILAFPPWQLILKSRDSLGTFNVALRAGTDTKGTAKSSLCCVPRGWKLKDVFEKVEWKAWTPDICSDVAISNRL